MRQASVQRHALSDALLEVGADAPTLCEGWTAYDLAAHCWVREHSARALVGLVSPRLAHLVEDEMAKVKQRMGFVELATRLRDTPLSPLTLISVTDDLINAAEFFIHAEDVRRANGLPSRTIEPSFADELWRRLPIVGRVFFRTSPVGVRLEREGTGAAFWAHRGSPTVTLVGRPEELLLFAFGREGVADVRAVGDGASVAALLEVKRGV